MGPSSLHRHVPYSPKTRRLGTTKKENRNSLNVFFDSTSTFINGLIMEIYKMEWYRDTVLFLYTLKV